MNKQPLQDMNKLLQGVEVEWKTPGEVAEISNIGVDKKRNPNEREVRLLNFDINSRKKVKARR